MNARDAGEVGMDERNGCLMGSGSSSNAEHEIELDGCHGRSCVEARVKAAPGSVCVCESESECVEVMEHGADALEGPRMTAMRDQYKVAKFEDKWVEVSRVQFLVNCRKGSSTVVRCRPDTVLGHVVENWKGMCTRCVAPGH